MITILLLAAAFVVLLGIGVLAALGLTPDTRDTAWSVGRMLDSSPRPTSR